MTVKSFNLTKITSNLKCVVTLPHEILASTFEDMNTRIYSSAVMHLRLGGLFNGNGIANVELSGPVKFGNH